MMARVPTLAGVQGTPTTCLHKRFHEGVTVVTHLYHHLKSEDASKDVVHVLQDLQPERTILKGGQMLQPGLSRGSRPPNPRPWGGQLSARGPVGRDCGERPSHSPCGHGPSSRPGHICTPLVPSCPALPSTAHGSTHVVPGRVSPHRVLGGQSNAAQGNHHEDDHLKVPHGHDVMAAAAEAGGKVWLTQGPLTGRLVPSLVPLLGLSHKKLSSKCQETAARWLVVPGS